MATKAGCVCVNWVDLVVVYFAHGLYNTRITMSDMTSNTNMTTANSPIPGTGGKGPEPKRKSKKKILILLGLVVLLLGAVAIGVYMYYNQTEPLPEQQLSQTEQIEKQISAENDSAKKATLYTGLSAAQQLDGDIDAAIESSRKSAELDESANSYAQLALIYEQKEEYALAIEYFNRAAELSPPTDNPDENTDYNYYKGRAEYLATQQ